MLDSLPLELHYKIFYHCKNKELAALSLVCRSLRFPAQSLLYTNIEITFTDTNAKSRVYKRMMGIQSKDYLKESIRSLYIKDKQGPTIVEEINARNTIQSLQLLQQLTFIQSLTLEILDMRKSWHKVINSLPHLKHLSMNNCVFNADSPGTPQAQLTTAAFRLDLASYHESAPSPSDTEKTQRAMYMFFCLGNSFRAFLQPSIVHLELQLSNISRVPEIEEAIKFLWGIIFLLPLPRLKTLILAGENPLKLANIQDLFGHFSSLEQLRIVNTDEYAFKSMEKLRPNLLPKLKFFSGPSTSITTFLKGTPVAHIEVFEIAESLKPIWVEGKDQLESVELAFEQSDYVAKDTFSKFNECHKLAFISIHGLPFEEFLPIWETWKLPPNIQIILIHLLYDGDAEEVKYEEDEFMKQSCWTERFSHLKKLNYISLSVTDILDTENVLYGWKFNPQTSETCQEEMTIDEWRDEMIGPSKEPSVWESYRCFQG